MKYYHRHLPHFHPSEAVVFITFRLANSLPIDVVASLITAFAMEKKRYADDDAKYQIAQKKYFNKFDQLLDEQSAGDSFLSDERVATVVKDALVSMDGMEYELVAFTIMPNHIHIVLRLHESSPPLIDILHTLKGKTAHLANKILDRAGPFWQHESYDHIVRNKEECSRIIAYMLNNPVKAGLVLTWEEWKWSYYKEEYL